MSNTEDEYTPTTEDVWGSIAEDTLPGEMDEVRAQFDRWLAGVKATAWDEGHEVGGDNWGMGDPESNPYR